MGLGKTLQAIALIAKVVESNLDRDIFGVRAAVSGKSRGPFMIVCPLSVVANWHSEFTRFTPALKTMVYTGDADEVQS
jgi:ATP-dependent DNA helicase